MDLSLLTWHKSSHSTQNGSCVEAATVSASTGSPRPAVAVRDSTDRQGPILVVTATAWQEFTAIIKSGGLAEVSRTAVVSAP
jgi:hypothetical protein